MFQSRVLTPKSKFFQKEPTGSMSGEKAESESMEKVKETMAWRLGASTASAAPSR